MATIIPAIVALVWLWLCTVAFLIAARAMTDIPNATTTATLADNWSAYRARHLVPRPGPGVLSCSPHDISITQKQVGASGIPRFDVAITNTCTDHRCSIRNIIAFCGQFTSASPINPRVFRRDGVGPNCIVNDLAPMASGQMLLFHYDTEFMEPIRLSSATVTCN